MTKVFSRIAKYGTVIGFMAAALMLIFGVRYFFERDLSLTFHRHWRTFAIRPSKEPVSIQIVGEVGGPLRKPGKWEAFNRLNGKEEVLALGTPSGRIEVAATPARLRMIQQRLAPPPGGPSVPR